MSDPVAFKPFVTDEQSVREFTPKAVVFGALFGLIFGASNVYLALKAGLTVSASIPIAVLAISLAEEARRLDHPREQHRADDRLGGRVDRLGRGVHAARVPLPRARPAHRDERGHAVLQLLDDLHLASSAASSAL